MYNKKFKLSDIHCASCVNTINKALNTIPDIEFEINFANRQLQVKGNINSEAIIQAVRQAGYTAILITDSNHEQTEPPVKSLLIKMGVAIALGVVLLLMGWSHWLPGLNVDPGRVIWGSVGLVTLAAMWYCGGSIYRGAWQA